MSLGGLKSCRTLSSGSRIFEFEKPFLSSPTPSAALLPNSYTMFLPRPGIMCGASSSVYICTLDLKERRTRSLRRMPPDAAVSTSALTGLGGCPFAGDDLVGNISTEAVLAALRKVGADPGIDSSELPNLILLSDDIRSKYAHQPESQEGGLVQ